MSKSMQLHHALTGSAVYLPHPSTQACWDASVFKQIPPGRNGSGSSFLEAGWEMCTALQWAGFSPLPFIKEPSPWLNPSLAAASPLPGKEGEWGEGGGGCRGISHESSSFKTENKIKEKPTQPPFLNSCATQKGANTVVPLDTEVYKDTRVPPGDSPLSREASTPSIRREGRKAKTLGVRHATQKPFSPV